MDRRNFNKMLATTGTSLAFVASGVGFRSYTYAADSQTSDFDELTKELLVDWCDGMIRRQINQPDNPELHGALACPACDHIHGRCSDALYPLLHLAHVTGDKKYLQAAIDVYDWAENNVSQPDGSWRVAVKPKSWRGTSIFGAIALAEALHYHGEVLSDERRAAWTKRLEAAAGGYLFRDFKKVDFTNVNYGMTAIYGFHLFGRVLKNQKYTDRAAQLASRVKEFFTEPNVLLWGEGKPNNNRSDRGLLPVDLGYNVEETLNGVALYALEVNDKELLELLTRSMSGHLEFMLPDGAWDNSWGTRSQKWSYWGSRTTDGCQPGFSMMADHNPAFGTAAVKNAQLLKRCTADGLLHGGPHFVSHGVKPCIHHTFAHAKVMALIQDRLNDTEHGFPNFDGSAPLPRETAKGVKHFPELNVWLVAKGPWRGTVSAYDSIYKTKSATHLQQPTGGSLSMLYHSKVGTLLAGSMARYIMVEPFNMQPQPAEDFALTPRIETHEGDTWYTNLYDLKAQVDFKDDGDKIRFDVSTNLQDEDRNKITNVPSQYELSYQFEDGRVTVSATCAEKEVKPSATLVLPVVSPTGEKVTQVSETRIEIIKPEGTVVVESNAAMTIKQTPKGRVFNMVPGAEAVPIMVALPTDAGAEVKCTISVV